MARKPATRVEFTLFDVIYEDGSQRSNRRVPSEILGGLDGDAPARAGNEMLDRARTETHLLSEFVSKMAGSHSVKDLKTMWQECGQHQIDFIRRDCERLVKHGERMIEATSKLLSSRSQS